MSLKIDNKLDKVLLSLNKRESEELLAFIDGYDTMPVDIKTFVNDDFFLGKSFPDGFWNYWLEQLENIFPHPLLPSKYMEIIIKGSIGTGKTFCGIAGVLYGQHRLLCLKSPQATYGLTPATNIRFALFNKTLTLAKDVCYDTLMNMFTDSPYFSGLKASINDKTKELVLPKRLGITLASQASHLLGRAVFGGVLDESNFTKTKVGGNSKIYETYIQVVNRMGSRFRDELGKIPGQLFLISSERDESDFLSEHIESIRKSKNGGNREVYDTTKIIETCLWEVKKDITKYSGKTFSVFVGSQTKSPCIIEDITTIHHYDQSRVISVPVEHSREFHLNLMESIRDIAGVSTISRFKYISDPKYLSQALILVNATRDDYIKITFDDEDQVIDYINTNIMKTYLHRNPFSPRVIHLDVSLGGDAYGFAMGTILGLKEVTRSDPDTKLNSDRVFTSDPHIIMELVLGLKRVGDMQFPLFKIRQLILDLRDLGFPIQLITADLRLLSADTLQLLSLKGFNTKPLSVDKVPLAFQTLRTALLEERFEAPFHPILEREFKELKESRDGRFDHPEEGCFSGDTRISLLDGTNPTIKELADNYDPNEPIYLYTMGNNGVQPAIAITPRLTRKNADTVIVVLDNGEEVCCTPDHRFMMRDGTYKQAQDLLPDDSLMPLYKKISEKGLIGYELYYNPIGIGRWHYTHRMVMRYLKGIKKLPRGYVVHHKGAKTNNDPRDLELMNNADHLELHHTKQSKATIEKRRKSHIKYWEKIKEKALLGDEDCIAKMEDWRSQLSSRQDKCTERKRSLGIENTKKHFAYITVELIKEEIKTCSTVTELMKRLKLKYKVLKEKLNNSGYDFDDLANWFGYKSYKEMKDIHNIIKNTRFNYLTPEQLERRANSCRSYLQTDKAKKAAGKTMKSNWEKEEFRNKMKKISSKIGKKTVHFLIEATAKAYRSRRVLINPDLLCKIAMESTSISEICRKLNIRKNRIGWVLEEYEIPYEDFLSLIPRSKASLAASKWERTKKNHKVVEVKPGPVTDVYDISVPGTQNFAISSGIFLHNSKDILDSVAGVTYSLSEGFKAGAFQLFSKEIETSFKEASPGSNLHHLFGERFGVNLHGYAYKE